MGRQLNENAVRENEFSKIFTKTKQEVATRRAMTALLIAKLCGAMNVQHVEL